MVPLAADGALAFLAAFGAFPPVATGAATGAATGTTTGTITGTATGTADPEVAGAVVWAMAMATTARKAKMVLNMMEIDCNVSFERENEL